MKKLIYLLFIFFNIRGISQNIGYFNYGQSGKASWSNHLVINSAGELVMAGYLDSKPCFVVADVTGAYVTNRVLASSGELFTAAIDAADNIYGGGYYGSIGAENKYIVKYDATIAPVYKKNYGSGNIRYIIMDGNDVVAAGFNSKPCVLKTDALGNIIWYKEYTIDGKNADAYMIHQVGTNYYMTGSLDEGGNARSYVLCVDATTGNVVWCKTYVGTSFSPHFTGMCQSPTGLILCGATAASTGGNPGNLVVVKIDLLGNIVWTRQVNGQYSWYMRNPTQMGNSWGISCAIDPYGAVIVAGETNNNYSMLIKIQESSGNVMWTKRYGNGGGAGANDDGFHGLTISGCTYLASGWMGPSVGSGWDFGLVVTDTSGFAGSSGSCGTTITSANSVPTINTASPTITSANLATATNYAGQNITASMSRVAICAGASAYSLTAISSTLCSGGSTTLSVNSGAASYVWVSTQPGSISGSTTSPSVVVTPTAPANYTCFVGGATGCLAMLTISISPSAATGGPTVTVNNATLSCANTTTTLTATGGGAYTWSGPGIISGNGSASVVVNQTGVYTVSVTAGGCTTTTTAIVSSVGGVTLSVSSQSNVSCYGGNNGSATVTGSGGTGPYTYTWNPGGLSGSSQTALSSSIYTITTSDVNGCVGSTTLQITQPTSSVSAVITTTTASCGSSNGIASVSASGGTAGYTYSWTPIGGSSTTAIGLSGGTYSVVVTDAKGCSVTAVANITSTNGPTLSITSQSNVSCYGGNNGSATVTGTGGTGPYTYTWNPGGLSGSSQTALSSSIYTITTSDVNGCVGSTTLQITQPTSSVSAVVTTTTASCGSSNGIASVSASGGTAGYTYSWTPSGGSSTTAIGLSGGIYSVVVTDAKGCSVTAVANITSTNGPTLSITSQSNVSCYGGNNGSATVTGSGGTGPYTYTWNPGGLSGSSQTALSSSIYTITTSDVNGCVGSTTLQITQPTSSVSAVITTTTASCGSSNGIASVSASGGTAGYTYSWTPIGGSSTTAIGLSGGTYSVVVTDAKGCSVTAVANITSTNGPTLSITSQSNVSCYGGNNGSATVTGTGGTGPYTYTWNPGGDNTATVNGLAAGTYTVYVSDIASCTGTTIVVISQSPQINLSLSSSNASCENNDGSASVTLTGGTTPISVLWSNNDNTTTISSLSAGNYSVIATDANGCVASGNVSIISSGTLNVNVGNTATIFEGQSTQLNAQVPPTASVLWSPAENLSCTNCPNPVASPTITTDYCALTTVGTCTNLSCVRVIVEIDCSSNSDYSTPNAFSPNDDGINDEFCLKGWKKCINTFYIAIYNRWGEKVYDSEDADFCWDGKFRGTLLNAGVFVFYIKATLDDGSNITRKGNINLIR